MGNARYRRDYVGEFVVTNIDFREGVKRETREWIPNAIQNLRISNRAAVIGSRLMQSRFDHRRLERHRGGLMGSQKLQTYGTDDIWTDMRLDFYVSTKSQELNTIAQQNYHASTAVMTNGAFCSAHPGKFYLIPYMPAMDDLAQAVYLAAFDGHTEIFLIGYHKDLVGNSRNWINDLDRIFKTYDSTQFYFVWSDAGMADVWRYNANVDFMPLRRWISYCDI